MDRLVNRRSILLMGGSAVAAAASTAIMPAGSAAGKQGHSIGSMTKDRIEMAETTPSFEALFPSTRYFEIDSRIAGVRFSAWVTLPAHYDADKAQAYPIVYQVDGNLVFPATAPFHQPGPSDPMSPLLPFILVSVGYSKEESHEWTWLRVRDLVPPGESVSVMVQAVEMSLEAGLLSKNDADRYLAMFAKPACDKFLGFLEDELHPLLAENFRIDETNVGLWGDSYGGLFTTYVAIKQSRLFKHIGAGSPGIAGLDSQVFKLYRQAVASKKDYSGRRLHISLSARELTQPSIYQALTARGTAELLSQTSQNPLPGLQVSAEIIPLETHISQVVPAWFSFLRACYRRAG